MSLVLTLLVPKVGMANSLPFSRMEPAVICSRRNCVANACLLGAFRSPLIFCPAASLPENVKTAMVTSPELLWISVLHTYCNSKLLPLAGGGAFCHHWRGL